MDKLKGPIHKEAKTEYPHFQRFIYIKTLGHLAIVLTDGLRPKIIKYPL